MAKPKSPKKMQPKLSLDEFKTRLSNGHYKSLPGARKAIARIKADADKKKADASAKRKFS